MFLFSLRTAPSANAPMGPSGVLQGRLLVGPQNSIANFENEKSDLPPEDVRIELSKIQREHMEKVSDELLEKRKDAIPLPRFQIGDIVRVHKGTPSDAAGQPRKWNLHWQDKYRVVEVLDGNRYRVENISNDKKKVSVEGAKRLKLSHER